VSVLSAVADSLRSKIAAEGTLLRHHLQAACAAEQRIEELTAQLAQIEEVLAEQPLDLPIGGQPQVYARL